MIDVENRLRATFDAVAADGSIPPVPIHTPVAKARRRRGFVTGGLIGAIVIGGGAITGAGVVPAYSDFFARPTPGAYNAKPGTERLLFTFSGPEHIPTELWYADATDHGYCVSFVLTERSGRIVAGTNGGGCSGPASGPDWKRIDGAAVSARDDEGTTFAIHVPGAASVRVLLDNATSMPLPIVDAWTAGWLDRAQSDEHPVLVAYDAGSKEIGRVPVV